MSNGKIRAYLDYNASAPLLPEAGEAMVAALASPGNASAVHQEGRAKRALIDGARRDIAALCGGQHSGIILTSGATEAAATLLTPHYQMGRGALRIGRAYVAATDHPCLLQGGRLGKEQVTQLPVHGNGMLDQDALRKALAGHEKESGLPLVACHLANNETGVIQPVRDIAGLVRENGGIFVIDAVQAAGRMPLSIEETGADFLILSSHKIGGPQGAGAIAAASDLLMPLPLIPGGGQEKGHRGGTENVAAIAGFGAAARIAAANVARIPAMRQMQERFCDAIRRFVPDALFIGREERHLPNTILFAIPGMKAETAQIAFDLAGVALSTGSACSSGRVGESHVLAAMGKGELGSALRLSFGHETGERELEIFSHALEALSARRQGGHRAA